MNAGTKLPLSTRIRGCRRVLKRGHRWYQSTHIPDRSTHTPTHTDTHTHIDAAATLTHIQQHWYTYVQRVVTHSRGGRCHSSPSRWHYVRVTWWVAPRDSRDGSWSCMTPGVTRAWRWTWRRRDADVTASVTGTEWRHLADGLRDTRRPGAGSVVDVGGTLSPGYYRPPESRQGCGVSDRIAAHLWSVLSHALWSGGSLALWGNRSLFTVKTGPPLMRMW